MKKMNILFITFILIRITLQMTALESDSKMDIPKDDCPATLMFEQIAYLQDRNVELPCRCKPDGGTVIWFYKRHLNSKHITLFKDSIKDKVIVDSASDKNQDDLLARFDVIDYDLVIAGAHPDDSGIYICGSKTGEFYYGFELDIQGSTDARVIFSDKDEQPLPDVKTDGFQAFTSFGQWSQCDRCGVRGEQRKIGLCYASSPYMNPRFQIKGSEVSCGSDAIPERFKSLIDNRPAEIFIRSCEVPCEEAKTGVMGKVMNAANNMGAYLKKRFGFLPIYKFPTQKFASTLGGKVTLTCPGAKPDDAVAWDKDDDRLYRSEYLIGTSKYMNLFIDHGNNLHIKFAQFTDKGLYTCWVNGKPISSVKLSVNKEPPKRRRLTDADTLFAVKVLGLCFLFCTILFFIIFFIKCCCYCCSCCPKFSPENEV